MKKMSALKKSGVLCWLAMFVLFPVSSFAEDGICAQVKIEIRQEMTLERQAFDAHMKINNGLSNITLENVKIELNFLDKDKKSIPQTLDQYDTSGKFFSRLDSKENISNIDGTGTVAPSTKADIHWLIIPTLNAANGAASGTMYYIGATLTYSINGKPQPATIVSPDYIFVKPLPALTLDYFLPAEVYGDDAFTPEIEPIVPFSLGVRVSNTGYGTAKSLKINSAQPKIVDNQQGLLIGFMIEGSEVNGNPATASLLADFGDIAPQKSSVARWIMTCSLSGKFTEFTADYSHSDELGGELTSIMNTPRTHILVRDVLVDIPGRDAVKDFLAKFGQGYKVFESENIDTEVTDQSLSSSLNGSGDTYTLSTVATAGFMYVKLTDPNAGKRILKEVKRSDGKIIKPENAWLSKSRDTNNNWLYFFNLFDAATTNSYTITFQDKTADPQAPVIGFINNVIGMEKQQIGLIVEASTSNGTIPVLSAAMIPAGAKFTDKGNGKGEFYWIPAFGQAGRYEITFTASDGKLSSSRRVVLTINGEDSDNDGIPDFWEMKYFGTLDRDGKGDFDGDGISDLDEYLNGTDPTSMPGDINQDKQVDLADAILVLRIASGITSGETINKGADVNGDGKIGMEETIYILQVVSGLISK